MSITAIQVEPAPPVVLELQDELVSTSLRNTEITHVYGRFEPIYGSFKLHRRNGEDCIKHTNRGGLVALTARVQHSVFVAEGAAVLGHSVVRDEIPVEDQAIIEGNAQVSGKGRLREETRVSGNAVLEGHITMRRHAHVGENAHLRGMIFLDYYAFAGDESQLFGNMHLE